MTMATAFPPVQQSNTAHSRKALFWDKIATKYAKSKIGDMDGYNRTIERTLALLNSDDNVVELGCGTGTTALKLAPHVAQYTGTDISGGMIEIARNKNRTPEIPGLQFDVATSDSVTPPVGGFDAVLGFNYLHLVPDVDAALADIAAMVKPGGLFVSKTPCLGEMNLFIRLAIPVMRLFGKAPEDVAVFDTGKLKAALQHAGFEIVALEKHASSGKDTRPFIVARKRYGTDILLTQPCQHVPKLRP